MAEHYAPREKERQRERERDRADDDGRHVHTKNITNIIILGCGRVQNLVNWNEMFLIDSCKCYRSNNIDARPTHNTQRSKPHRACRHNACRTSMRVAIFLYHIRNSNVDLKYVYDRLTEQGDHSKETIRIINSIIFGNSSSRYCKKKKT